MRLKRLLDLSIAITAITLFMPIMGIICIILYFKLGRPILFRQQRPGLSGMIFTIYKFRTMTDKQNDCGELLPDADRILPIGHYLRRTSLDELPQLFNVLRGNMSVVGPRPLLLEYLERYTPEQNRRHEVKPGITGWAQINGRNTLSWNRKFDLDLWYVDHQSIWLDIKIISLTVRKVLRRDNINQRGQATAKHFIGR